VWLGERPAVLAVVGGAVSVAGVIAGTRRAASTTRTELVSSDALP
jgi:hypothetical protein